MYVITCVTQSEGERDEPKKAVNQTTNLLLHNRNHIIRVWQERLSFVPRRALTYLSVHTYLPTYCAYSYSLYVSLCILKSEKFSHDWFHHKSMVRAILSKRFARFPTVIPLKQASATDHGIITRSFYLV